MWYVPGTCHANLTNIQCYSHLILYSKANVLLHNYSTLIGMSALSMAEGIPYDDGKVVTLEFDDKYLLKIIN